jgi:F-type H+-transporting ATPase subunit epsilon
MSDAFHLQIISPAAVVVDAYVKMTEVPGTEGDFGVLPGHAPFFSMIRPGVINVLLTDGYHRRFFAASGYADVSTTSCTILSDHIQDVADISMTDAQEALAAARAAVAQAVTDAEKAKAQRLLSTSEALVAAIHSLTGH